MTAGRPPIKTPETIDVESTLDPHRVDAALTMARYDAQDEQQRILQDVLALGSDIGIVTLARIQKNISAVAETKAFERINKSKAFKHIAIPGQDGVPRLAENIDEFCRAVFGKGYKAMSDQKQVLDKLGEETFEAATRLGLNRAQLRLLVNIPEDTRAAVDEAMQDGSKSDVVALIQSLANQLDEAKQQAAEFKADIAAKEERLAVKNRQVDALEEKLSRSNKLPPDAVALELQAECTRSMNDSLGALRGRFAWALRQLDAHEREHNPGNSLAFMAGVVGQVQAELDAIRDSLGIPDVLPALIPEWVTDPAFKNFAAN